MITSQPCIHYLLWMMCTAFGLLFIKRNVEGWGVGWGEKDYDA